MTLDSRFVERLLTAADPLEVIWEEALALWQPVGQVSGLPYFYNRQEEVFSRLEELLYHSYFEVYDLLLERAGQQDGGYVRERLHGEAVVIVADSLSVRETGLLSLWLGERGWEVHGEGFAVAPFPTTTESLAEKLLGTSRLAAGTARRSPTVTWRGRSRSLPCPLAAPPWCGCVFPTPRWRRSPWLRPRPSPMPSMGWSRPWRGCWKRQATVRCSSPAITAISTPFPRPTIGRCRRRWSRRRAKSSLVRAVPSP
jgi:hypothetical protein